MGKYIHNPSYEEKTDIITNSTKLCGCSDGWGNLHIYKGKYYIFWCMLQEHEGIQQISEVDLNDPEDYALVMPIEIKHEQNTQETR